MYDLFRWILLFNVVHELLFPFHKLILFSKKFCNTKFGFIDFTLKLKKKEVLRMTLTKMQKEIRKTGEWLEKLPVGNT